MSEPTDSEFHREQAAIQAVSSAYNFEQLYAVIDSLGEVPSKDGKSSYTADNLKRIIGFVRQGTWDISTVTNTYGIQIKVEELFREKLRN